MTFEVAASRQDINQIQVTSLAINRVHKAASPPISYTMVVRRWWVCFLITDQDFREVGRVTVGTRSIRKWINNILATQAPQPASFIVLRQARRIGMRGWRGLRLRALER
jgi:hypothetical protein